MSCAPVCVFVRVCLYGHSPQELRRAPRNRSVVVSPLATTPRGEKRRQNDRGRNDREGPSDGARWKRVSRSSSRRNVAVSSAITLIRWCLSRVHLPRPPPSPEINVKFGARADAPSTRFDSRERHRMRIEQNVDEDRAEIAFLSDFVVSPVCSLCPIHKHSR